MRVVHILLTVLHLSHPTWCIPLVTTGPGEPSLNLTIIHINDIHAYFEETNSNSARCRPGNECFGGVARIFSKQKEIREEDPEALFLNAGDFYQGTVWYSKFKYRPMIEFGNWLNYSAMGLGNHDFDDSIDGLAPFANNVTFSLLAANINDSGAPALTGLYQKSVVLNVKGVRVGIIGYITRTTEYNFPGGDVTFLDEVESVRAEAERLAADGVCVLIALGHSGYEVDLELARQVDLLDLVVGGHSHTFLYTPTGPDDTPPETPAGQYPTYVENVRAVGKIIPVVQAKAFTKYLGHLRLRFDAYGDLMTPVDGEGVAFAKPHLMDSKVKEDPDTLVKMAVWQEELAEYKGVVGSTLVEVKDEESDSVESNMGNLIADSMAAVYPDTSIAFMNNGGIRNRFEIGNITLEDIFFVLPFNNTVDLLELPGRSLRAVLERAATRLDSTQPDKYPGFGLQVAGLRLEIFVNQDNQGSRLRRIQVRAVDGGKDERYEDLVEDRMYRVAVGSYLAPDGLQHYQRGLFDDLEGLTHTPGSVLDAAAMEDWVKRISPINITVEGRLSITYSPSRSIKSSSGERGHNSPAVLAVALLLAFLQQC